MVSAACYAPSRSAQAPPSSTALLAAAAAVLLLAAARPAAAFCDAACVANCTAQTKLACAANVTCGAIYYRSYVFAKGSVITTYDVSFARRGAPCASAPVEGAGFAVSYLDPRDNSTWIDKPGFGWTCKGADIVTVPAWTGPCYVPSTVASECATWPRPAERLVSIWQPGYTPSEGAAILASLERHPGVFNAFSPTFAFWNSQYQPHCNDSWLGTGLCFVDFDANATAVVAAAARLGALTLPIIETCCVCVLNASYDFAPAMDKLVANADAKGYSGYAVDIECGGAEVVDYSRMQAFMDRFGGAMRALGKTVSYWVHYTQNADMSFPNAASYIYTMDSYEYSSAQFVNLWVTSFACQAGIGLEYPGDMSSISAMFADMAANQTLQAAGVWGALPDDNSTASAAWWAGLRIFRDAWVQ